MRDNTIRSYLNEDTIVFDSPAFDRSIIGMTFDGRAIYELQSMINELSHDDSISYEDAIESIEYNTIRSLPYIGEKAPIVLDDTYFLVGKEESE